MRAAIKMCASHSITCHSDLLTESTIMTWVQCCPMFVPIYTIPYQQSQHLNINIIAILIHFCKRKWLIQFWTETIPEYIITFLTNLTTTVMLRCTQIDYLRPENDKQIVQLCLFIYMWGFFVFFFMYMLVFSYRWLYYNIIHNRLN